MGIVYKNCHVINYIIRFCHFINFIFNKIPLNFHKYTDEDSSASYHDMSDHDEDESTDLSDDDELEINNAEDIQIPEQYNPQDQDLVGDHLVSYL